MCDLGWTTPTGGSGSGCGKRKEVFLEVNGEREKINEREFPVKVTWIKFFLFGFCYSLPSSPFLPCLSGPLKEDEWET